MLGADEQKFIQFHRWHSHAVGASSVILMRCPEDYADGVAHRVFVEGRLHAVKIQSPISTQTSPMCMLI